MDCGMGTALGTAHLIAAFEEEQKVNYKNSISLSFIFSIQQLLYVFFNYVIWSGIQGLHSL